MTMGRIGGGTVCDALGEKTWRRRGRGHVHAEPKAAPFRPGGGPKFAEKCVAPISAKRKQLSVLIRRDTRTDSISEPFLLQPCAGIPHVFGVICPAFVHVHKHHEFCIQVRVTEGFVRHEGRIEMLVLRAFEVVEMGELRLAIESMSIQW